MKTVRWTPHAEGKLRAREIESFEVELTVTHPDAIMPGQAPRRIYQRKYYDKMMGEEMLLRVVVEETQSELVVVTVYRTSKVRKYIQDPDS